MTRPRGFTLVEVLVALMLVATAAAALAATLGADRRLRTTALVTDAAARQARERIETLAGHCGSADTSGMAVGAWGVERWRVTSSPDAWRLADTIRGSSGHVTFAVAGAVACRP